MMIDVFELVEVVFCAIGINFWERRVVMKFWKRFMVSETVDEEFFGR